MTTLNRCGKLVDARLTQELAETSDAQIFLDLKHWSADFVLRFQASLQLLGVYHDLTDLLYQAE